MEQIKVNMIEMLEDFASSHEHLKKFKEKYERDGFTNEELFGYIFTFNFTLILLIQKMMEMISESKKSKSKIIDINKH